MSHRWQHRDSFLRWAGRLSAVVVVVAGITSFNVWRIQGYEVLSVQSGSMAPLIKKGDAVFLHRVIPADIRVGEIVSYPNPTASQELITHRVISVDQTTGRVVTAGDANQSVDPAIDVENIAGVVQGAIPRAGVAIDMLHSWWGLVALVYLPAALVLVQELRRVARFYGRPTYVLYEPSR